MRDIRALVNRAAAGAPGVSRLLPLLGLLLAATLAPVAVAQSTDLQPSLTSISPAEASPGSSVNVTIEGFELGGGILNIGPGISTSNLSIVQLNDAGAEEARVTFSLAQDAPLNSSTVSFTTGFGTSNALLFTIVAPPATPFAAQQSFDVFGGGTVSASVVPTVAGQSGLSATLVNNGTPAATLVTSAYPSQPVFPPAPILPPSPIFGFVDLQVLGAVAADTATARFYYPPTPIAPPTTSASGCA